MPIPKPETLLSVAEVAKLFRVCRATVYKWCETGLLPHIRIVNVIRVVPADLEAFIARERT